MLPLGTRFGPYEISCQLGAGGLGEVYRAKDQRLGREVALKVLRADLAENRTFVSRFEREAKVLASLNHPNIAQIHDIEESGTVQALVMEYVPGQRLSSLVRPGGSPVATVLNYARQIALALASAHERGIIHRDLKP